MRRDDSSLERKRIREGFQPTFCLSFCLWLSYLYRSSSYGTCLMMRDRKWTGSIILLVPHEPNMNMIRHGVAELLITTHGNNSTHNITRHDTTRLFIPELIGSITQFLLSFIPSLSFPLSPFIVLLNFVRLKKFGKLFLFKIKVGSPSQIIHPNILEEFPVETNDLRHWLFISERERGEREEKEVFIPQSLFLWNRAIRVSIRVRSEIVYARKEWYECITCTEI